MESLNIENGFEALIPMLIFEFYKTKKKPSYFEIITPPKKVRAIRQTVEKIVKHS